jgi:hypothetical protein
MCFLLVPSCRGIVGASVRLPRELTHVGVDPHGRPVGLVPTSSDSGIGCRW